MLFRRFPQAQKNHTRMACAVGYICLMKTSFYLEWDSRGKSIWGKWDIFTSISLGSPLRSDKGLSSVHLSSFCVQYVWHIKHLSQHKTSGS